MSDYRENFERVSEVGWPDAARYVLRRQGTSGFAFYRLWVQPDPAYAGSYDALTADFDAGKTKLVGKTSGASWDFANAPVYTSGAFFPPYAAHPLYDEAGALVYRTDRPVLCAYPVSYNVPLDRKFFYLQLANVWTTYTVETTLSASGPDWQGYLSHSVTEYYPSAGSQQIDSSTFASGSGDTVADVASSMASAMQSSGLYTSSATGSDIDYTRIEDGTLTYGFGFVWTNTGGGSTPDLISGTSVYNGTVSSAASTSFQLSTVPTYDGEAVYLTTPT